MRQDMQEQICEYFSYLQAWDASYAEYAKSVGLSFTSLAILSAIHRTEKCTQKLLAEQCFLPKQTVNAVITSFYKRGRVELRELPEDRRNKTVHLTETGWAEAEHILRKVWQCEQSAMSQLTEDACAVLLSATRRYVTGCKEAMKGL